MIKNNQKILKNRRFPHLLMGFWWPLAPTIDTSMDEHCHTMIINKLLPCTAMEAPTKGVQVPQNPIKIAKIADFAHFFMNNPPLAAPDGCHGRCTWCN